VLAELTMLKLRSMFSNNTLLLPWNSCGDALEVLFTINMLFVAPTLVPICDPVEKTKLLLLNADRFITSLKITL
jgi:hypothetical protein